MNDLIVPSGPGIPNGLVIPQGQLVERFARSSGPGGQSVNTTDSRVQLSFDIAASTTLTDTQRGRLIRVLGPRLVGTVLTVDASENRSQHRNRGAARERMAAMLREGLAPPPPPRRATRPSRRAVQRRLNAKKQRSETKLQRRRPLD